MDIDITRIENEKGLATVEGKIGDVVVSIVVDSAIGAAQMPKLYGIWAAKICQNYLDKKSHYLWHPKLISASQINYGISN